MSLKMRVELKGTVEEVIRSLLQLADQAGEDIVDASAATGGPPTVSNLIGADGMKPAPLVAAEWSVELATEFVECSSPAYRRVLRETCRAGEEGIHRSALCCQARLTPDDLRSLLISMSYALKRFQRERGLILSKPVETDHRLQRYFINPSFAVVVPLVKR